MPPRTERWSDGCPRPSSRAGTSGTPPLLSGSRHLRELVDFRGEDEIRLRQPIHRMRPESDLDLAPSQKDVRMMALLFGERANSIYESQGGLEVRKLVNPRNAVFVDDAPLRGIRQLLVKFLKLIAL